MPKWPQIIAHADMDAFYASVEQLDNPSLRGRAVVVGPESARGVVLAASYEARKFNLKSAMPMADALRRCPGVKVVPPRFERYQQISTIIMSVFTDFSPNVEAISLDEAFIDMTGAERIFGSPADMARQIQEAVLEATGGLSASVGIASTKYVAKVASDFNKPNGLTVVSPQDAIAWLDPMPVSRLWGAGRVTVPRLEKLGLFTIGDIRRADTGWLCEQLGSLGVHFQTLAQARDPRRVARRRVARSMGSDRTLLQDVSDPEQIKHHLRRSSDRIGRRLRDKGYRCCGVRVKLKTTNFELLTRQQLLPEPTNSSVKLYESGVGLLNEFPSSYNFRLVGLAAYDLVREGDPVQLRLFDADGRPQSLEHAIDQLNRRYGSGVIIRAGDLGRKRTVADVTPNLDFVSDDD